MRMSCAITTAIASLLLVTSNCAVGEDPRSARDRFLSQAPIAWAEAEKANEQLDIEATSLTNFVTAESEWTEKENLIVKMHSDLKLLDTTKWPAEGKKLPKGLVGQPLEKKQRVDAVNADYCFSIQRQGEASWEIRHIGPKDEFDVRGAIKLFRWPLSISSFYLPDICRGKDFQLGSVEELQEGGKTLFKAAFDHVEPNGGPSSLNWIRAGWVVLDPQRSWSIVRGEVSCKQPNGEPFKIVIANEYLPEDVKLLRATLDFENSKGERTSHSVIDFHKYLRSVVPLNEFTLANYGLEKPRAGELNQFGRPISYFGKTAPALAIRDARGVPREVKLEDFHGKWVLLEFWGVNCQPCLEKSLPALTKFYEEHRLERDRFEILAICVTSQEDPQTVEGLDAVLAPVIHNVWHDKPLPFPILIDRDSKTFDAFEIISAPTGILIDPAGIAVSDGDEKLLAEKLKVQR